MYWRKPKTTEHSKLFQCNNICWFIPQRILLYIYLTCVFLQTVLYFFQKKKKGSLLRILRLLGYFETPLIRFFFPFPLGLRNSGFNCISIKLTSENKCDFDWWLCFSCLLPTPLPCRFPNFIAYLKFLAIASPWRSMSYNEIPLTYSSKRTFCLRFDCE